MGPSLTSLIWKVDVDSSTKLILLSLASFCYHKDDCYPSVGTISRNTGLSERTVRYKLRAAKDQGILRIEIRSGRHGANRYVFLRSRLEPFAARCSAAVNALATEGHSSCNGTLTGLQPQAECSAASAPEVFENVLRTTSEMHRKILADLLIKLKVVINPHSYSNWIQPLRFIAFNGETLVIEFPSAEYAVMFERDYAQTCKALLTESGFPHVAIAMRVAHSDAEWNSFVEETGRA